MYKKILNVVRLMRMHQPIGFFLLLWPTLWGLWLTNTGIPDFFTATLFITGTLCMRSAGCVINDYIDVNIDRYVKRTQDRPLIDGAVKKKEALIVFFILILISAGLVLNFNINTIFISLIALILSIVYPFLKRYIYLPQLVLGIIFSISILMTCTAVNHPIDGTIWLLFFANTIWTVVYDTQYAMLDRYDDYRISIKSSALLFGNLDKFIIGILQFIIISIFIVIARQEKFSILFYLFSVIGSMILFIWQQIWIYHRSQEGCFKAFLSNNYVGLLIFIGIILNFY